MVCNRADEDERGWDFFIQYPDRPVAFLSEDERPAAPSAVVQLKTTRGEVRNWSITLRNALHLVRSPIPAFILMYVLTDEGRVHVHGIHLWRTEIGRVLLAARKADLDGDAPLNRRTISFGFDAGNLIDDPVEWMRREIEAVGSDYSTQKERLLMFVGRDDVSDVIRMSVRAEDEERFMDMQVGLIEGMDVVSATITSRRFGLEARRPRISMTGGRLELKVAPRDGRLRLRLSDGDSRSLQAKVLYAVGHRPDRFRLRVTAGCLDLTFDDKGRNTVCARMPYGRISSLEDVELFASLHGASARDGIRLTLSSEGRTIDLGSLSIRSREDERQSWSILRRGAETLRRIAEYEDVAPISTSIEVLGSMLGPLFALDALASDGTVRIEFEPIGEPDGGFDLHLSYGTILIEGQVVGAVATRSVIGDEMISDRRRRITLGAARIVHAVHGEDAAGLRDLYLDEVDRLAPRHRLLATGDIMRLLDDEPARVLLVDEPRATVRAED